MHIRICMWYNFCSFPKYSICYTSELTKVARRLYISTKKSTNLFVCLSIIKGKDILLIDTNGFKAHILDIIHVQYKPRNSLSVCTEQIFNLAAMVYCMVYDCSMSWNENKSMSFCGLPKTQCSLKLWIDIVKENILMSQSMVQCKIYSTHFSPSRYLRHPCRLADHWHHNARAQLNKMMCLMYHG